MLCISLDQWDVQEIIKRIVAELQGRGYLVWFDRKCRKAHAMCTRVQPLPLGSDIMLPSRSGAHEGQCNGKYCWTLRTMH